MIGSPHQISNNIVDHHLVKDNSQPQFFSNQYQLYRKRYQANSHVSMLGFHDVEFCDVTDDLTSKDNQNFTETYTVRCERVFNQVEAAGCTIKIVRFEKITINLR